MSLPHIRRVWPLDLPAPLKWVLMALADQADDRDECFPGLEYLQTMTSYSRATLKRLIPQLIDRKLVEIVETSKRGQYTRYRLILEQPETEMGAQDEPSNDHGGSGMGAQDEPSTQANGGSSCTNGGSSCSPDLVMTRAGDPVLDPFKEEESPHYPPKGEGLGKRQYPYEFEYYFWDPYPKKVGKRDAFRAFKRERFTLPQLKALRDLIHAQRTHNPKWKPDKEGRVFIPNPRTWLRGGRFDDPVLSRPGKPRPCPHPPERVANDARGELACLGCNHVLSPAEADRRGLTAEGEDGAREALAEIQVMLGRRA